MKNPTVDIIPLALLQPRVALARHSVIRSPS